MVRRRDDASGGSSERTGDAPRPFRGHLLDDRIDHRDHKLHGEHNLEADEAGAKRRHFEWARIGSSVRSRGRCPRHGDSVGYLDRERVSYRDFPNPEDGLRALQKGQIEAFVYDRPLLSWIVMQQFPETLRVLDFTIDSLNYAIAVPKGSRILDKLNSAVLEETESDWWRQTLFQYLRKKQ